MKKALSYKFILLFITLALSLALAFSISSVKSAHAATSISSPDSYFRGGESLKFEDDNLVATVKSGDSVSVINDLIIDDAAFELVIPADVKEFTVTLSSESYFVGGAYNEETKEFDTNIKNVLTVKMAENKVTLNNQEGTPAPALAAGDLTVKFSTTKNVLSAEIGGTVLINDNVYYKIKGADKCAANVSFGFTLNDGIESANVSFKSIDQKQSDGTHAYKQTFELEESTIKSVANPRVAINNLPIKKDDAGNLKVIRGNQYTFSFTTYSVFGNGSTGNVYTVYIDDNGTEGIWVDPSSGTPKSIIFENNAATTFSLRTGSLVGLETYSVLAAEERKTATNTVPKYIDYVGNETVYGWYRELVNKATLKEYTDADGNTSTHSIRLGDTYTIPSLENLVEDDLEVYSNLSYTVYYRTPSNASGTATSLKFTVSEAGEYMFFVVFKDASENEMDKDKFIIVDEYDENDIAFGDFGYAVFTFTINDDAPIAVEAPASQGKGYLNTKYTAAAFDIQSSGNNVTYTLYYNPAENATETTEGWIKIPLLSEITEDYNENGFTYADIEKIDYDGAYTFTPIKKGSYRIDCYVTSDNSVRFATDSTLIKVADNPAVVKVDDHWLQNNIWSVVFLSIGTLSLIGIIVLLFIKPKEEVETDETGEALKVNAKK